MMITRNQRKFEITKPYRCIVHIGFHKTGTTSIQHFLHQNRERLRELGVEFYHGQHIPQNHVELHGATMRFDRTSTFRMKSDLLFDETYLQQTTEQVKKFVYNFRDKILIFSAEGLSLLFYADETDRLAAMLPAETEIIVYQRNPVDYLRSHKRQFEKNGITGISDKKSHAYTGLDTWLIDYESRLKAFRATFGPENVHVIDYDDACARDGNIIPSFLRHLNLSRQFDEDEHKSIWLNKS